eukprot:PhF_6_TR24943/c0_g1_i1/m.34326
MAMEVAARFIALRDNGEDEAVVAMMTENATLGTVWGCISGKKNISNYLKDEKRFRYLEKKFGPLKQKSENIVEREGFQYKSNKFFNWSKVRLRESFVVNIEKGRIKAYITHKI